MKQWEICKIRQEQKIVDAVKIIDSSCAKIALVVDRGDLLLGTITDYDVRQAILQGHSLQNFVTTIMNRAPKYIHSKQSDKEVIAKMKLCNVRQMPLVDENKKLIGLKLLCEFDDNFHIRSNPVLIMAGGMGTRLRPLTDHCPKPLLKVGNKPILEIILDNFIEAGFSNFYFSVNYKAEMIKRYFGDGANHGVKIRYLEEKERLGTAGAMSLLPAGIEEPVIVMNGDLLTKVNFHQLLDFHNNNHAQATMCVREYNQKIPYGVVKFEEWKITELQEKPAYSFFVNAGIYVLAPEIFYDISKQKYLDMTDLFNQEIQKKKNVLVFPIREYWLDVGKVEDFERAQVEFS